MMRARRGMTLIELTVSLTITGLALGVGYTAFGTLSDRRMEAAQRADDVARAAAVRRTIANWLADARLTIEEDEVIFRGVDGVRRAPSGDVPDDEITFFTSAPTQLASGGTIVHLHVVRGDSVPAAERGLVADLSGWRDARRQRIVLDTAVTSIDVSFLSSVLGQRTWLSSWVSSTILPAGGRVTLGATEGRALAPLLALPITVSLENGR
jgi:prepilin-type N-terminal cleavage/methylation domain-containing protein